MIFRTDAECAKASILPEKDDPAVAAAEEARAIASPTLREEMTRRAMQAWALKDPEAALAWAAELPDQGESGIAMMQVCAEVAESDPAAAIRLAVSHRLDEVTGGIIGNFTASWAARDLSAARDWVTGQPAGEFHDQLMERIAFEYAKTDPPAAAQLVVDRMGSGESQIEAAISVLHQWAIKDLPAATAWVALFPDGTLRDRASLEVAGFQSRRPEGSAE
ncbi:MAG: hypothetical protein ABIT37_15890 [Luteolibacter sp.]